MGKNYVKEGRPERKKKGLLNAKNRVSEKNTASNRLSPDSGLKRGCRVGF